MGRRDRRFLVAGIHDPPADVHRVDSSGGEVAHQLAVGSAAEVLLPIQNPDSAVGHEPLRHLGEVGADLCTGRTLVEAGVLPGLVERSRPRRWEFTP